MDTTSTIVDYPISVCPQQGYDVLLRVCGAVGPSPHARTHTCIHNNNIVMEICKAPTLRLKALNKHTHIMYIEMENVIKKKY